ncbi:hypothetical protein C1645_836708 [Glomus cerebriforme]|uniref:Uncharacterized protein n=1 Tax=Glomus cerebriforme TaxID=658196 RepID=A0A397SGP8_9GLOM|nr:hypothetical protein C1645_836708 [Glomus cerebriforme]
MTEDLKKAVKTGKPSIHPHRIRVADLETLWLSPATLKLFSCIVDSQPNSVHHLAQLLSKNCEEIEKDINSLQALGIIKLQKVGKKVEVLIIDPHFEKKHPYMNDEKIYYLPLEYKDKIHRLIGCFHEIKTDFLAELKKVRKELSNPNYSQVNFVVGDNATPLEKFKYEVCQNIARYKRENELSDKEIGRRLGIKPVKRLECLFFSHIKEFTLDELVEYAKSKSSESSDSERKEKPISRSSSPNKEVETNESGEQSTSVLSKDEEHGTSAFNKDKEPENSKSPVRKIEKAEDCQTLQEWLDYRCPTRKDKEDLKIFSVSEEIPESLVFHSGKKYETLCFCPGRVSGEELDLNDFVNLEEIYFDQDTYIDDLTETAQQVNRESIKDDEFLRKFCSEDFVNSMGKFKGYSAFKNTNYEKHLINLTRSLECRAMNPKYPEASLYENREKLVNQALSGDQELLKRLQDLPYLNPKLGERAAEQTFLQPITYLAYKEVLKKENLLLFKEKFQVGSACPVLLSLRDIIRKHGDHLDSFFSPVPSITDYRVLPYLEKLTQKYGESFGFEVQYQARKRSGITV